MHKLFRIVNGKNVIMVLMTTEVCLIYDNNFNENLISILSEELEFDKFVRYRIGQA